MKEYLVHVEYDRSRIFEAEFDTKAEVLECLNCFDFGSNEKMRFFVYDDQQKLQPLYHSRWGNEVTWQ